LRANAFRFRVTVRIPPNRAAKGVGALPGGHSETFHAHVSYVKGGIAMKSSLTLLVLVLLLLNILAGCAPGPNQSKGTASEHGVAGFWLGLWQGFIAPFVFVASLFKGNLNIYEVHND
jgi:hypothetical protein